MSTRPAARRLCAGLLLLDLLVPARAAAYPTDGSTLALARSVVPSEASPSTGVRADLASGAATYAVEIALPPGTGGLTPSLSLRYASASRSDAWVGHGWSLGLSSISRSLARGTPSYDDARDGFELDGERLVPDALVPGRFHTERESFVRIEREADGSWTLRRRDGVSLRFGTRSDARVDDDAGRPFEWLLAEQEDPHGNVFVARYDRRDPGSAYLSEIRYGLRRTAGGGLASLDGDSARDRVVSFTLEARPDQPSSRLAGLPRLLRHRLASIDVRAAGALVRRYRLHYAASLDTGRSLLAAVALHGSDADGPSATPPLVTSFGYRSNVASGRAGWRLDAAWSAAWPAGLALVRASRQDGGVRLADVNGDGLPDLVKGYGIVPAGGGDVLRSADSGVYLNTGAGFDTSPSPDWPLPVFTGVLGQRVPLTFANQFPDGTVWSNGVALADLTGDGRADTFGAIGFASGVYPSYHGPLTQSFQAEWCRAGTSGFACLPFADTYQDGSLFTGKQALVLHGALSLAYLYADGNTQLGDLDGDALPELVVRGRDRFFSGASCSHHAVYAYVARNEGDLRFRRAPLRPAPPNASGCGGQTAEVSDDWLPCDVVGSPACADRLLFAATRWLGDDLLGTGMHFLVGHTARGSAVVDLDADGLADTVSATTDYGVAATDVWLNAGHGRSIDAPAWRLPAALQQIGAPPPSNLFPDPVSYDTGLRFVDVNGDGRLDLVRAQQGVAGARGTWLNDGDVDESVAPSPWVAPPLGAFELPPTLAIADASGQDLGVRFVDLDGDGMTDVVRAVEGAAEVWLHEGVTPDLLASVTSPFGGVARLEYAPSTRFDHSGADGRADLPQVLPLLSAIETDDGVSPPARTTFAYRGGLFDAAARRLRGFREVTTTLPDGRTSGTRFHQDEARAGLVESTSLRAADGALWEETSHLYTPDDDGAAPWRSLLASTTRIEWDGGGAPRRLRSDDVWDVAGPGATGNLLAHVEWGEVDAAGADVDAADTLTTELAYSPPGSARHLVDRVARRRAHAGPPGTASPTRETLFFYDGDTTGAAAPTRGLVTTRRDVLGEPGSPDPETRFGWDAYGNLVSVTGPRANAGQGGGSTTFELDPVFHAFRVAEVNALGQRSVVSYAADASCPVAFPSGAGLVQIERGPNDLWSGTSLRRCHDAFGRVTWERAPLDLAETRWSYDDTPGAARVVRSERARAAGEARSETTRFDGLGRPIAWLRDGAQGRSVVSAVRFDASGRIAAESGPDFAGDPPRETRFAYDPLDRLVETAYPGPARRWRAEVAAGVATLTDPTGGVVRRRLDGRGRVVRVEEGSAAATRVTQYAYDAFGEPTRVVDSAGNAISLFYDRLGRRRLVIDPDAGPVAFEYDADGNVLARSRANGVVSFAYDALGRLRERRVGGVVDATWTFDTAVRGIGRPSSREDAAGRVRVFSYDLLGRPTIEIAWRDGVSFQFQNAYDPLGQPASRTLPTGQRIEWLRDARGLLQEIRVDGATVARDVDFDARGRLARWTAGSGLESEARFDPASARLEALSVRAPGGGELERLAWRYDGADRVVGIDDLRDAARTRSFAYDEIGRLSRASGPFGAAGGAATLHYAYDAIGNLVCKDASATSGCVGGTSFEHPGVPGAAHPHAPLRVDGVPALHDVTGNLTGLGLRSYAYDGLGQLVSVRDGGVERSAHVFDGEGRRARIVDRSGPRVVTRHILAPDFEWDATRGVARLHVELAGHPIATFSRGFARQGARVPPAARGERPASSRGTHVLVLVPHAAAAVALALVLASRRRRGHRLARPAVASVVLLAIGLGAARSALGRPDGDLNADGRLDAADALLVWEIARGARAPSAAELDRGDVAPLELAPEQPARVNVADAALVLRALRGDDVDGDGVATQQELDHGASPFRADTDRDGLPDADEIARGTDPARTDTDADGASDAAEVAAGSDPTSADTDGDGVPDGADPQPLAGTLYRVPDPLGTPLLVTGADGAVLERPLHRPFGDAVPGTGGAAGAPFGYTGQRHEPALGLYDYGARFYDPALGRFLQPDEALPDPFDPTSLHRYAYVRHDPLRRIDPSGRSSFLGVIFGAVIGALASASGSTEGLDDFLAATATFGFGAPGVGLAWNARDGLALSFGPGLNASFFSEAFRRKIGAASAPPARILSVSDLRFGDVLLTRDGGLAQGIARVPGMEGYGHSAFVLDHVGGVLSVASSDNRGRYQSEDSDPSVGGRTWDVFRTGEPLSPQGVASRIRELEQRGGLNGGLGQYLDDHGANVCSSFTAELYVAAGGRRISLPTDGPLVTPGEIARRLGPPAGRVFVPLRFDLRAVPETR
jgi:RHS repeat-associated protein